MKCTPMTCAGRRVTAATLVIGIAEVLTMKMRRLAGLVECLVHRPLDIPVLGDVLDHEVRLGHRVGPGSIVILASTSSGSRAGRPSGGSSGSCS